MTDSRRLVVLVIAAAPLLTAALWMDHQPSYRPYRAAAIPAPAGSVPVSAVAGTGSRAGKLNPVPATPAARQLGQALFELNCAMCHGRTSSRPGPVGRKLTPPPPGLDHDLLQALSDAVIFQAMTEGFGRMPSFRDKLTVTERWNLVHYLRTRR